MRDWFKARNIWGASIMTLTDEEAGRLMKALWDYTMNGNVAVLSGAERCVFALILLTLSQDAEKDSEISAKRAEAGSAGGKQRVANALFAVNVQANQANALNKNKNKEQENKNKEQENKVRRFTPPSLEEVEQYCRDRENQVNPQQFIDFYTSKGWKVGNSPMKDWKACVRTWEQRNTVNAQQYDQRDYAEVQKNALERQRQRIQKRLLPAQDFEQRDYSEVQSQLMDDLVREVEAFKASQGEQNE